MAGIKRKGITIEIGANTDGLVRALKQIDKECRTAKSSLTDINKLLKIDPSNMELLDQKFEYLGTAIESTRERLKTLRDAQDKVAEGSTQWDALQREIIDTDQQLTTLVDAYNDFYNTTAHDINAKALKDVREQCEVVKRRLDEINDITKKDPMNATLLSTKQKYLQDAIEASKDKFEKLLIAQENVVKGSKDWEELQHEITLTAEEIKQLTKEYNEFGSVSNQQWIAMGDKMQEVGGKMTDIGGTLTKKVTAPIVAGFTAAAKAQIDWESSFAGVKKTVEATDDQYRQLADAIGEIATRTASSREEIAATMEIAGQLGVTVEDDIAGFTEVMVKLGDTTNLSAEEAATAIAKFANVTKMSLTDVDKLGSVIVDLGNNYATTEADIMNMATRLSSAGHQIGLTEPQILGFATALSSVGLEAQAGGSAFSKSMTKMQVAVETGYERVHEVEQQAGMTLREMELLSANNSKEFKSLADSMGMTSTELKDVITAGNNLNDFAKVANMTTDEFVQLYRGDVAGALQAFITGLGDTETHGESTIAMLDEMGFKEIRLSDTLRRLASNSELVTTATDQATAAWEQNSAMNDEAAKRYETMAAKLSQTKERLKMVGAEIGENLYPTIDRMISIVEKATTWFSNLDDRHKKTIVTLGLVAAAIGPVITTIGSLITNVGVITKAFGTLSSFLGLAGPGGILFAMAAVVTAGIAIYENWDKIVEFGQRFKEKISRIWEDIRQIFAHPIQATVNFLQTGSIHGADVQRYASAYEKPVVFTRPTVLQTPQGPKMFGDGAGAEVVMGLNKLRELMGGQQMVNTINIYTQPNQDEREIANYVIDELIAREERAPVWAL